MSLRIKIPLILMLMVAFNAALGYGIQRFVILPSFARLEYKEAQKALDRCVQGLGKEVERLDELCLEWARRDRTYAYLEAPNAAFEEANLSLAAYAANELNLICRSFPKPRGRRRIVWCGTRRQAAAWPAFSARRAGPCLLPHAL